MLGFSVWTFLSRLAQVAMLQGDKVVAARVAGIAALPVYSVPFGVAQKLNFLGAAAVTAVVPAAAQGQARGDFLASYFRTARVVHLCTAAPAIVLLVWAPMLLQSWVGAELAEAGAGLLRAMTLGYWVMSVASVEAGCLDGWGRPRLNAMASLTGLGAAAVVFVTAVLFAGRLWAVAGAVTSWMIASAVVTAVAWQRVSGFPAARLARKLLQPIAEMAGLGLVIAVLASRWIVPGPWGLLAGVALGGVLLAYGFMRLFPGAERRAVLGRLVSAVAS
jgi:O-antigen/teichoic acid export membrane protein